MDEIKHPSSPDPQSSGKSTAAFRPASRDDVRRLCAHECTDHADRIIDLITAGATPIEMKGELTRSVVLLRTAARLLR